MKRQFKLKNITLSAAIFFLGILATNAQQNISAATLSGTIEDSNGASVKGVSVVATNLETNRAQEAVSDESGRFRFAYLTVGNYKNQSGNERLCATQSKADGNRRTGFRD